MTSEMATHMRWHVDECPTDGSSRHLADSLAWTALDGRYPTFASDSQNVIFGLVADGFNPYRTMNSTHSTWPMPLIDELKELWSVGILTYDDIIKNLPVDDRFYELSFASKFKA
ncbi:hypothetical protein RHSIM_RhsimUnG0130000 [Rhododendron simsii]|uniref:Uncharacterized protein n=1 Tax=Rhododendron simsii TaxID=118357 RepID=A0A834G0Y2_RHOSS|nr:hypothetical protein RHSIM_RhsimUnG0130000 [Rhododendron simsii]